MPTTTDILRVRSLGLRVFTKTYKRRYQSPADDAKLQRICEVVADELGIVKNTNTLPSKVGLWDRVVTWVNAR